MGLRAAGVWAMPAGMYVHCEAAERLAPDEAARHKVRDGLVKIWARRTLRIIGVEVEVDGPLPPPSSTPRLIVSNHRTALDIPVLLSLFGGAILSRGDIEDWPLLGASAKKAGCIFVDRSDPRSGARAIREIRSK